MPHSLSVRPSEEEICSAITMHRGRLGDAARSLGIRSTYIRKVIRENPMVMETWEQAKDVRVDIAETALDKAVKEGDVKAIVFLLSTLGKDRGYSSRVEHTGKDGGEIEVTLNLGRKTIVFDEETDDTED